jgi:hypothetical protein
VVMVAREARRSEPELFAPVSQSVVPEAAPAAPSPISSLATPVSAPQQVANTAPVQAQEVVRAEPQALEKKADIVAPVVLKQKTAGKISASNALNEEGDREASKDLDQLKPVAQARTNTGTADKAGALAGVGGSLAGSMGAAPMDMAAGKATLQARDINGPATQASFGERQQLPDKKEAFAAEWKGDSSAIASFKTVVVTNDTDWKALWAEHTQNQVPPPPVPDVDFSRFVVVGVFAGIRQDLQGIAIQDIQVAPDSSTVLYKEQPLDPAMGLAAPTNRPYHLKQISKSALPVTFTKQPQ